MSAAQSTAEALAAWEASQQRLDDLHAAALPPARPAPQASDHTAGVAAAASDRTAGVAAATSDRTAGVAAAAGDRTAGVAAAAPAADNNDGRPPQLHTYIRESQVADSLNTSSACGHLWPSPPPSQPVPAPGGAAAAAGVADADCVDNRRQPPFRGPPAPLPAGEVHDGSQTRWNLVSGLRLPGDGGVTKVRKRAPFGPYRVAPFDNTPFRIPTASSSSPPRPAPTSPPPLSPLQEPDQVLASVACRGAPAPLPLASSGPQRLLLPPLPPSASPVAAGMWPSPLASTVADPWTAAQSTSATWTPASGAPHSHTYLPSASALEADAASVMAAVEVVASEAFVARPGDPPASLAAPFPPPAASRARAGAAKTGGRKKRSPPKARSPQSCAPRGKKAKAAVETSANTETGVASARTASAPTPEAVAVWNLVSDQVASAVRAGSKELWAALKKSTAEIEHLRADTNRLEARVDGQGQSNERTAMAVASLRVAAQAGAGAGGSRNGANHSTERADGDGRGKEKTAVAKVEDAKALAMSRAPENDRQAARLRRPIRAAVKRLVAKATISRDILMDADTATAVIHNEVIKTLDVTPAVADSYLMNHIYFSSSAKGADPTKKRPMSVIMTTIPHSVAQIREFVLKPFFKVLGFPYNPMPSAKAKKWAAKDCFITSYKGEKALVSAAKNMFMKVGGGSRIVKDKAAGSRCHVEMVVGHHALIASFARNEFEIALGKRSRRRGGNDTGAYLHWVDEFAPSIKHLLKNHKDHDVYAGYRITDVIDPDMVVRTTSGGWVFTAPPGASVPAQAAASTPTSTPATSARPPLASKPTAVRSSRPSPTPSSPRAPTTRRGAESLGTGFARRSATGDPSVGAMANCDEDYGVAGDEDGRDSDGISVARPSSVVIVVDNDTDHGSGAALIGLDEERTGSATGAGVRRSTGGEMSAGRGRGADASSVGGIDESESDGDESDVGARTSSSDDDDSDGSSDSSDDGQGSGGACGSDNGDEEEADGEF